jgi:hypothetical protein
MELNIISLFGNNNPDKINHFWQVTIYFPVSGSGATITRFWQEFLKNTTFAGK